MEQKLKKFSELTAKELYEILRLRVNVFVVEQNCPYPELDGLDECAYHLWFEDENGIAAYLRLIPPGVVREDGAMGRVISARRRSGLGSQLMQAGIRAMQELYGSETITIEAQVYAKPFYEVNGFRQISDEFDEDGIPHILMKWEKNA